MDTTNEKLRRVKISETMSWCGHLWERYKALRNLQHPVTEDFKINSYASFRKHYSNWRRHYDESFTELFIKLSNPMLIFTPGLKLK